MTNYCTTEFELNFKVKTNKDRILPASVTVEEDIVCDVYTEECHGYHTFYEIRDDAYEHRHNELFEEFNDLERLQEALLDELEEDEDVIEIVK